MGGFYYFQPMEVPLIDFSSFSESTTTRSAIARQIARACTDTGFFYISGHGVDQSLQDRLEDLSWQFFRQHPAQKEALAMIKAGRAWRGYFGVGAELTSGKPDLKEGLYFGQELPYSHPEVKKGTPLHGSNLFPSIPHFKNTVLAYLASMTELGHTIMAGIAISLQLPQDYFIKRYLKDPLILFRIFHYPRTTNAQREQSLWGVGEHTDYGVLTILKQDKVGGLQVKSKDTWIDAPYIPGTFVCNIGDMLDSITSGYYRSTPHRVVNQSNEGRLSFPFFFDPNYASTVTSAELGHLSNFKTQSFDRWDGADLKGFSGTYGSYLLAKVAKVFPQLFENIDN